MALCLSLPWWWLLVGGASLGFAAALFLRRSTLRRRTIALGLALASLLTVSTGLHLVMRAVGPIEELAAQRATVSLTGALAADPRIVQPRDGTSQRQTDDLVVVRLAVTRVEGRGLVTPVRATVLIFADRRWNELRWKDTVQVRGRLSEAEKGADVSAVLNPIGSPQKISAAPALLRGVELFRTDLRDATASLPADARGLTPAMVIGDVSRVPPNLSDDMRTTGMTHLTAVSGTNVTIVLLSVLWVCGWLRVPRRARVPICLVALGLFVLLCRPEPSVARAAVMGLVGLLATSAGRPRAAAPALGGAVVVLLILDPWLARSYGFALSVLATLGLVLFARPWGAWFADRLPDRMAWLGEPVAIPVAAQVMCTPIIVVLQGAIPLVGIPANLLAAPLVAPATVAGVLVVLVAPVVLPVAAAVGWLAALPTEAIAQIAHSGAAIPGGMLPWPGTTWGAVALALITAGVVLCGTWLIAHVRRYPAVVVALTVVLAAAAWPLPQPGWPAPGWVFVACEVGQGDAGVIRTGPGRVVVVDVGPDPTSMDRCLDDLEVHTIDAVVLTHFHADHVAGLPGVLDGREVGQIITTSVDGDEGGEGEQGSLEPMVTRVAAAHGVPTTEVNAGDDLGWAGVRARVIWPGRTIRTGSVQNNASVVLDVRVGEVRLVLLGDAEREAQFQVARALALRNDPRPVDVVKVAHHGSANHEPRLLRDLSAPYAVISVGAGNDYGHPAPALLTSLHQSGSQVLRTDRQGDIALVDQAGRISAVTRKG